MHVTFRFLEYIFCKKTFQVHIKEKTYVLHLDTKSHVSSIINVINSELGPGQFL